MSKKKKKKFKKQFQCSSHLQQLCIKPPGLLVTNYHTVRDYQVTIVYCDISRYCIQYKKSGTFKLIPQSSYLSEQYTCIDLKHSQSLQVHCNFIIFSAT